MLIRTCYFNNEEQLMNQSENGSAIFKRVQTEIPEMVRTFRFEKIHYGF